MVTQGTRRFDKKEVSQYSCCFQCIVYIYKTFDILSLCNCYPSTCWIFRISAVTRNATVLFHFGRFPLIKAVLASVLPPQRDCWVDICSVDERREQTAPQAVSSFCLSASFCCHSEIFGSPCLQDGKPVGQHPLICVFLFMRSVWDNIRASSWEAICVSILLYIVMRRYYQDEVSSQTIMCVRLRL